MRSRRVAEIPWQWNTARGMRKRNLSLGRDKARVKRGSVAHHVIEFPDILRGGYSQMKTEQRFHTYVTGATITVMYFVLQHGTPLLAELNATFVQYLAPVAALLLSVGIYKTLASGLLKITRRWKFVKRWMLGASYINGTWVGKFSAEDGSLVYTVEHFEQDLSELKIRGQGQRADGSWFADWESEAANIDERAGKLTYIYTCQKQTPSNPFHGVCEFHFQRADAESRPTVIHGFSADLPDGRPTENNECQVSEDLLPFKEAFPIARQKA